MAKNFWENDEIVKPPKPGSLPWEADPIVKAAKVTQPEEYGIGTAAADVGKLVTSGAVSGIAGAPETVQAASSSAVRESLFKPTEILDLIADPRKLTNKLVGSVGLPPIFEATKDQPLVPADVTKKQRAAVDETLTRGKIPQLRQLTEFGKKISEDIENTVSPEMKLAMAESQPTGNILKAIETGDFSEVSMGKNPTALGLTGHVAKVFGTSAPQFLVGMVTKTPTLGAAVGFGQAGSEGIDEARNYVKSMDDNELAKNSEYFRNLVALGYSPSKAREMTEDKAADTAAMAQGTVGALGGAFTSKLLQGGFDKTLLGNVKSRLGKVVQGTAIAGAEGALTEMAEGVATDLGIDKTIVREIGVDSFANLVLGAIGEAAPGAIRGAIAPGKEVKGEEAPEVKPTEPVAPAPAAPAELRGAIPESDIEVAEGLTPVSLSPEAVTPSTEPKQIDQITARLDELEAELKQIDAAYPNATPEQFTELNARQGQIKSEMSQLIQAATTGAPITPVQAAAPVPTEVAPTEVAPTAPVEVPEAAAPVEVPAAVTPKEEFSMKALQFQNRFIDAEKSGKLTKAQSNIIFNLYNNNKVEEAEKRLNNILRRQEKLAPKAEEVVTAEPVEAPEPAEVAMSKNKRLTSFLSQDKNELIERFAKNNNISPEYAEKVYNAEKEYLENFARYGYGPNPDPDHESKFIAAQKKYDAFQNRLRSVREKAKEKKVSVPEIKKPVVKFEEAKTGVPFDFDGYRGEGKSKEEIYAGAQVPVVGKGFYVAKNEDEAKFYGENISKAKVKLDNPLVIRTDNDWRALTKSAGWEFPNPFSFPEDQMIKMSEALATKVKNMGHDGLVIDPVVETDDAKTMWNVFGHPQVIDYKPKAAVAAPKEIKTQAEINRERQAEKKAAAEKAKQPVDTSGVKDLIEGKIKKVLGWTVYKRKEDPEFWYVQSPENHAANKIGQGDDVSTNLDTARSRIEQHIADAEYDARKAAEKPVEKKAKEEHIEGKKSEPVTSKTIEEAIDKAEVTVDSSKIKTAIKNQFEQAIKRAKIQTELEWERAKGLLPAEKFVTISVPGDGQFKVKNNVERLKELQTKMVNATTLKGPTVKGSPSSGSIEAFKGMVDDKDMENAIEYAKLKGLDPKTVKLNPTQRSTVDDYLKNPAEFERQKEESEQMAEARQTALRADQEKRIAERLEADEKRQEEARFKAVLDTTIRSTQPQLKGDIAKRKITSMDAARILEVIPSLPTGTVKPYVTKELEKIAEPKAGVVTDDEGEKLDFPLFVDMANKGYKVLGFNNPRTYADKIGNTFRTIEKDGVRLALEPRKLLFKQQGKEYGRVQYGIGKEKDVTFEHLTVDPSKRKKGLAKQAIQDLVNVADKNGYTLYLEPAQLEKKGITKEQLSALYSKYGFAATNESGSPMERMPKLADESKTIDVEAIEITPSQMKLLTNQVGKLSDADVAALEEHYGIPNYSSNFMQRIREDIITYTNKGADAIDKAIRSIIAKLQAGVLAVAIVFNPAYMSEPSAVVFPSKPTVEQVRATVPESAKDMSDGAKKAYATLYPALQESLQSRDKLFTIVDKPTSKMYVFNPDGSLLVKDNVLLGKALGDTYVGQTEFKENRVTPAGLIKVKAEKGSATYDGKTIYTFGNVKEDWRAAFIHTVYLKESDAEARKKALETGKDTRMSHGCINAKPELMAKIAENNRMDESHVFVVPDNQAMVDDYIANTVPNEDLTRETVEPVTKTTQVPEKPSAPKVVAREEKAVEQKTQAEINRDRQLKKLAQGEKPLDKPYYNDFTSNIDSAQFVQKIQENRDETIREYAQTRAAGRRALKKIAKYGSDIRMQKELNELLDKEELLKSAMDATKPIRNSAADFMARATQEMANENISPEVEAVIRQVYQKYPAILDGLRLSIRTRKAGGRDAGNFNPYARIVTLWKDSSGVEEVSTVRHELTHSLEQMMTPEARKAVVEAWARSFENAIKRNPDEKSQEFFNKVFDFLDNPTKETFDAATKIMPSYDFYQYMNPSEYWAVNAEKLFAAKLGTPWARFVSGVKKIFEALKSVLGMNNTYAVHKAFNNIMNGTMDRAKNKEMLIDYLLQGKTKIDFLNSVEDIDNLMDKHNRPEPRLQPSDSIKDKLLGGYQSAKAIRERVAKEPTLEAINMIGKADRAITKARNKNVFFGTGLQMADFAKYGGQVRNGLGQAIASIAVTNAIKAGHVGTQVMVQGKLVFDAAKQQFGAVKDKMSMANVIIEKNKLAKKLGEVRANKVIQAYFEAKRSRSIVNEYLDREAAYEMAIEAGEDPAEAAKNLKGIELALEKVNMDDEAITDFIDLENQYPELRKMMDNWTAVNHNMLDMMEFAGVISKKRAAHLKSIKDYVPWYRIMDEQTDVHSPTAAAVRTMTNVGQEKKFRAGQTERDIDDIVDNMIHNVMMMTRNSMRNYAANRVVMEYGERYTEGKQKGKLRVFPQEGTDADGVRMNIVANGRRIIVRIKDPLIAESVIGMENIQIPMNDTLAYLANGLRRSITFSGVFQVKQLFMDAPTAAWVSGVKSPFKVWGSTFASFLQALKKDDEIVDMLKSFGVGGFQSTSRTPEKELKLEIGLLNNSTYMKAIKFLDHVGDSSDYAQRRAVYKQVLKESGDEMLALFQANNVIDFNKRGSGDTAQFLTRTVAFMNAYAQQFDVLAQTFAGGGFKGKSRGEAFAQMYKTGAMLASVSLLYAMAAGADDDYWELDDQTRLRSIYIPFSKKYTGQAIVLPMHTTASFFFKAMPELLYNKIVTEGTKNEIDRSRLLRAMGKAAVDSLLSPNVTPTGVKPFLEIGLNRNFFTGSTVVPRGMEDLEAAEQYNANTSELGKVMSALTGRVLNPIEADHLMRGLGGSVAAMAMWGSNLFAGDRPEGRVKDIPIIGQFVLPEVPRLREDLYYDLKKQSDKAYDTYMKKIEREKFDEADKYYEKNEALIATHDYVTGLEAALKNINKQMRMVGEVSTKDMSKREKRDELTDLQKTKQEMLEDVIEIRKDAGL